MKRAQMWISLALLVALILSFTPAVSAQKAVNPNEDPHFWNFKTSILQQFGGQSLALAVDAAEEHAYFNEGAHLCTVDIHSDPDQVTDPVCDLQLKDVVNDMVLVGQYLYLANGDAGLTILDVSDRHQMVITDSYITDFPALDIQVVNGIAYLTTNSGGLSLIDISDPYNIVPLSFKGLTTPVSLGVSGNYVYVGNYAYGMEVFNVSDPENIPDPTRFPVIGLNYISALTVEGHYAYVADIDGNLVVFNISNPASPVLVDSEKYSNVTIQNIEVKGNSVYLAQGYSGICVLQLNLPSALPPACAKNYYPNNDIIYQVGVGNGTIYTAGMAGFSVISEASMALTSSYLFNYPIFADAAEVNGFLYVAAGKSLLIFDGSTNEWLPVPYELLGDTFNLIVPYKLNNKTYLVACSQNRAVYVIDISDPYNIPPNPTKFTNAALDEGTITDLEIRGPSLFLLGYANIGSRLISISLSNPASLSLQDSIDFPGLPYSLTIFSWMQITGSIPIIATRFSNAYVALGYNGIAVLNVQDPTNLVMNKTVTTENMVSDIVVAPSVLHLNIGAIYAAEGSQVTIYNADLSEIGAIPARDWAYKLALKPGFLYVGEGERGISVYRIDDQANPTLFGWANTPGSALKVRPGEGTHILTGSDYSGFTEISILEKSVNAPFIRK